MAEQLVDRQKVIVSYTQRTRGRGEHKKLVPRVNLVRMYFNAEPIGTTFYVNRDTDGIHLAKEEKEGAEPRTVNRVNTLTKGSVQQYVNLRGFVEEEGIYDIYQSGCEYILRPSKVQEKPKMPPHTVRRNNAISIGPENYKQLVQGIKDPVFVCEEHYRPHTYLRIRAVEAKAVEGLTGFQQQNGNNRMHRPTVDCCKYKKKAGTELYLNRYFFQAARLQAGDALKVWLEKDGALIVEPPVRYCEVCGKPIRQYSQQKITLNLCGSCHDAAYVVQATAKTHQGDLKEVVKAFLGAQEALKGLIANQ